MIANKATIPHNVARKLWLKANPEDLKQLLKTFIKLCGLKYDLGLAPTLGTWPRWSRIGKHQDASWLADSPDFVFLNLTQTI